MGVTWVMHWKNASGPNSLAVLTDKLTDFGSVVSPKESYVLQCKMYRNNRSVTPAQSQQQLRFMYTIGTRHGQQLFYTLVDDVVVESERETELIMAKLRNLWEARQNATIESHIFSVGDFVVRLGNMNVNSLYKGIMIEIEYRPLSHPYTATPILQEFKDMLLPADAQIAQWIPRATSDDDTFAKVGLSEEVYTTSHTMYQYMQLLKIENLM
ncbi:821_t:CDS:2 [Ambispora leptoticha]|uniref:Mediator of RNA polymerase II transcription subunit 20 n=1 Tax=Ambispora leptoticha TaxID=144679 RepID=A0A9N8V9E1_9GLOM|nr:821_t:CDS:2 [Ambispora leptoticha]